MTIILTGLNTFLPIVPCFECLMLSRLC